MIRFTKQNTNYHHQNIIDLLRTINNPVIQNALNDSKKVIQVIGDIHRSQFLADNPEEYYWLRIQIFDNTGQVIAGYEGIHIFVSFRLFYFQNGKYIMGQSINPPSKKNTDIADISDLFGFWEFRKMTNSFQNNLIKQMKQTSPKERIKKPLKIINPKTGKEIE